MRSIAGIIVVIVAPSGLMPLRRAGGRASSEGQAVAPATLLALAVALVALAPPHALGQFIDADQLARVESIAVVESLEPTDAARDCVPRDGTLATAAELILRRAGVTVVPMTTLPSGRTPSS